MSNASRPKEKIMFPNAWAVNSFLLKLKRNAGWEFVTSTNATDIKVKPTGAKEYMQFKVSGKIGDNNANVTLEVNAEKLGPGIEGVWKKMNEYANLYRC